jgi:hypothetical protein
LAAFGREPSNLATVWSNGATDGGSHDPHRDRAAGCGEAPKKSIPGKTAKGAVLKNPVPEAARTGLQDFWMGRSEPMIPIEEKIVLRWTQMKV